jgi:signal recognition particle receptor subunit beta
MMVQALKVFVIGAAGAGKTEFIASMCVTDVISTSHSNEPPLVDFGRISIDDTMLVYLIGNKGAKLIQQTEDAIKQGLFSAYLVLIDPAKADDKNFIGTKTLIEVIRGRNKPFIIAASKRKDMESYSTAELRELLELPEAIPFLECDPMTDPDSAKRVLVELFKLMPQDDLVIAAIEKLRSQSES